MRFTINIHEIEPKALNLVFSLLHILDGYVFLYLLAISPNYVFVCVVVVFQMQFFFVCVSVPLGFREIRDFVWRRPSSSFMFQITVAKYIICENNAQN